MKVSSPRRVVVTAKDFRILFSVRSIIFHRQRTLPLRIYLQKDVQVIGAIAQLVPPLPAGTNRCFSEFTPPIEFRMAGEKVNSYSVSLYEVEEEGEHHLETAQLRFSKFMEDYCREFQQLEEELSSELREKEKEHGGIAKLWKSLCARFTKRIYTSAVRFPKSQGILEFAIQPLHPYDDVVREAEAAQQAKRQKRERQEQVYKKTRTIPQTPPQAQNEPTLRRGVTDKHHNTDSDLTLVAPFEFQSRKQLTPSKRHLPLKSGILKENKRPRAVLKGKDEVLSNIAEVSDSYQSFANSNKTNQPKKQKKLDLPILGIGEKHASAQEQLQKKEQPASKTEQKINFSQEKWLISALSRPHDILEIQSAIELKQQDKQLSDLKQNIVTGIILLASVVAIYILMHPLSRV